MVEKVEYFCAELRADRFPDLCILEYRKVDIVEAGTCNRISAEITEVENPGPMDQAHGYREGRIGGAIRRIGRIAYGVAEPLVHVTDHLHWSDDFWADCRTTREIVDVRR